MNKAIVLILATVGAVAAAVTVGLALGPGQEDDDMSRWAAPYAAVCRATALADAGQRAEARTVFYDDGHEPLHELARTANTMSRAQSAKLLAAKEGVEAATRSVDADLGAPLAALADEVRATITLVDRPVPPCPELDP